MKIQTTIHEPIESQGISGQGNFSIKTSSHAFRLLSSGLYTNKVQAVIRELSCNAADAHVMNGNQKVPFDIKLPNGLDGQFYVRDYGPGMSDEDVMKLYTTYFESTKQQSNDFTGGFGVGSKSPFAYTDMFTVVSIHNGTKSTYSAYVDDDGEPKIAKLGDGEPTDEPSGLSVGFPVKPEDQRTFQQEAQQTLSWFTSPVNVLGVGDSQKPERFDSKKVLFRTPNVVMYGTRSDGNGNVHLTGTPGAHPHRSTGLGVVVMGNVHYPLPHDACLKELPQAHWFAQHNAVFTVPIGSVSVAASREALAFDKFTKASVKTIVEKAFTDVAQEMWKLIEKKSNISKGKTNLEGHLAARQTLHAFQISDPQMVTLFLDAINATPEQRQLFEPRFLVDPKHPPKTFSLVKLERQGYGRDSSYKVGPPMEWSRNNKAVPNGPALDMNGSFDFVENGARMHGARVEAGITAMVEGLNKKYDTYSYHRSTYMLVPHEKATAKAYEEEKAKWQEYLGVTPEVFSKMGEVFKNEGIPATNPYDRYGNNQSVELLPTTPPFFWVTETQFKKLHSAHARKNNQYYHEPITPANLEYVQKNLGMKTVLDKMYVISDSDVERIKKVCPNGYSFVDDFCIKTLLAPKMQAKIAKIKPMMNQTSSTFSSLRGKVRRDASWADTLKDSKLGQWVEHMQGVKGTQSYDFTTMEMLKALRQKLGADVFPTVVPELYDGVQVENTIRESYPFLETHISLRATLGVQQLQHLKSYLKWCEDNGATPPGQERAKDDEPEGP